MNLGDELDDFVGNTIHTVLGGTQAYINASAQKELVKIGAAKNPATPPTIAPPTQTQVAVAAVRDPSVYIPLVVVAGLMAFLVFRRAH